MVDVKGSLHTFLLECDVHTHIMVDVKGCLHTFLLECDVHTHIMVDVKESFILSAYQLLQLL
jgi:hypothetical protein